MLRRSLLSLLLGLRLRFLLYLRVRLSNVLQTRGCCFCSWLAVRRISVAKCVPGSLRSEWNALIAAWLSTPIACVVRPVFSALIR